MTAAVAWDFQVAINDALAAALPGVDVHFSIPESPPERYIRVDGFTVSGEEMFKNLDTGRHGVTVHMIDSPTRGTKSLKWVKQTGATVDTALRGITAVPGALSMVFQSGDYRFEERADKVHDAHGVLRYSTIIHV